MVIETRYRDLTYEELCTVHTEIMGFMVTSITQSLWEKKRGKIIHIKTPSSEKTCCGQPLYYVVEKFMENGVAWACSCIAEIGD